MEYATDDLEYIRSNYLALGQLCGPTRDLLIRAARENYPQVFAGELAARLGSPECLRFWSASAWASWWRRRSGPSRY